MLTLLPVALLLLSAVVIRVLGWVSSRPGSTWFLSTILGFITWLSMILVGILQPATLRITDWLPEPYPFAIISFQVTRDSWVFGFLLVSTLLAIIFYNAQHLDSPKILNKISGAIVLTAFGLLATFSSTPLAFVLSWSLLDLAEFVVLTLTSANTEKQRSTFIAVVVRELGVVFLVLLMSVAPESVLTSEQSSQLTSWFVLLIILLRMGILPLRYTDSADIRFRRVFTTLLRTLPFISVLSFMTNVSNFELPVNTINLLLVFFSIAALYGAISWYFAKDELNGRPFWFLTLGSLSIIAFLVNGLGALSGLAIVTVVAGTGIFLNSPRLQKAYVYLPVLMAGLLALPFTPTITLNHLFAASALSLHQLFGIPAYALLLAGVIKQAARKNDAIELVEPWMRLFHNISLYFIAVIPWIILAVLSGVFDSQINWWVSLLIIVLAAMFTSLHFWFIRRSMPVNHRFSKIIPVVVKISQVFDQILRLNWLSKIISSIGFIFSRITNLLIIVQEGDGGILWSFLFLVLLLSLLFFRQVG